MDGQFGQRPHHPAFEVVYVYSQSDGSLDLNFRGARTAVEPLQGLFAATRRDRQGESPVPVRLQAASSRRWNPVQNEGYNEGNECPVTP